MRSDGVAQANAHGCMRTCVEAQPGMRDWENGPRYVHCVCALRDIDYGSLVGRGEGMKGFLDDGKGAGESHWECCGGSFLSRCSRVRGFSGGEVRGVRGDRGIIGPGSQSTE